MTIIYSPMPFSWKVQFQKLVQFFSDTLIYYLSSQASHLIYIIIKMSNFPF